MLLIPQGFTYASDKFIDCPDCNNGHSPSCKCGGKIDYLQNCDLCNGVGELRCDLCNGTGTYEDSTCNRCAGDGSTTCNRCNGDKKVLSPCRTPSCSRCGGTGGYPEGSPEHLQQLRDKGKELPVPVTEKQTTDETATGSEPDTTGSEPDKTEIISKDPIVEISQISQDLIEEKKDIRVAMNVSIAVSQATPAEIEALAAKPAEELNQVLKQVENIVMTASSGKISDKSKAILDSLTIEKNTKVNTIYFDEHQSLSLDFPVEVRIPVNPEDYQNMETGYAYHILIEQGTVEYLGEAELIRDENGAVIEVAFITQGFSDFFIASEILEISPIEEEIAEVTTPSTEDDKKQYVNPWIILAGIIVVLGIAGLVIGRKKLSQK